MPKVSVIMPAYNAEKYIGEAIDSILKQSFADFELIILNDCSKDGTEDVIHSYQDSRICYLKNEKNLGVAGTLNKGVKIARGEYVARMDSDDIAAPERLQMQVDFLERHPETIACGSNAILFGAVEAERKTDVPLDSNSIVLRMALSNPFVHPTMLIRTEVLRQNVYDIKFEGREDYRLWMVLSQKGPMANLPEPLLRYRIHPGQVTRQLDEAKAQKHFLLKKTYYRELNAGLTDSMQEALCHGAFYGKVKDVAMAEQLKAGMECLIKHYGLQQLPEEYCTMLLGVLKGLPRNKRWQLSKGLSLKKRITVLR